MSQCLSSHLRSAAVRAARSAAVLGLEDVAAAVGVSRDHVVSSLMEAAPRGRCAQIIAEGLPAGGDRLDRMLSDAACGPSVRRAHPGEYAAQGVPGWRSRHVQDSDAPAALMRRCAGHPDRRVRLYAAVNVSCPPVLVERLSTDDDWATRAEMAKHPFVSCRVLERLAADPDIRVVETVARHPALPAAAWEQLAAHTGSSVRGEAASNPSASPERLWRFAADGTGSVRMRAALNPACGSDLLERLERFQKDSHPLVSEAALINRARCAATDQRAGPRRLSELAGHRHRSVRAAVAANSGCPTGVLSLLISDTDSAVRIRVAANAACPVDLLERLSGDPDAVVRSAAARNPKIGHAARERCLRDEAGTVQDAAICNPATSAATLRELAASQDRGLSEAAVVELQRRFV